MKVRALNEKGIQQFREFILELTDHPGTPVPESLLTDPGTSHELDFDVELEDRKFDSRFEMAEYLVNQLAGTSVQAYLGDGGLWSWLGLYWFSQLCPADEHGYRNPSKPYNYILSSNFQHQPRHAIRTSYLLYKKYGSDAKFLLCNPMDKRGDLTEQLSTRQFFIECDGVMRAASRLYSDASNDRYKSGSASPKRKGNVRRYIAYLRQIELTYDLYSIRPDDLLDMLPREFDDFKQSA